MPAHLKQRPPFQALATKAPGRGMLRSASAEDTMHAMSSPPPPASAPWAGGGGSGPGFGWADQLRYHGRTEVPFARRRVVVNAVGLVLLASVALALVTLPERGAKIGGVLGAVFFLGIASLGVRTLAWRGPAVVVDERGLVVAFDSTPVPWSEIREVGVWSSRQTTNVIIGVSPEHYRAVMSRKGRLARVLRLYDRARLGPHVAVHALIDGSPWELAAWLDREARARRPVRS